jgi:glucosamine-6-phosphate deaminase
MKKASDKRPEVKVFETRQLMGEAAARAAAGHIRSLLKEKRSVNMIFAAAASQNEFLEALAAQEVEWHRIRAFHMDEYIGLPENDPQLFSRFLRSRLFDKKPFQDVFYINGQAGDWAAECERYEGLLEQYPVDITCLGIGENSHIAFNDPHVADFSDPRLMKVVELDDACRQQQVNEGCFATREDVPPIAFTLTIPAIMSSRHLIVTVPGASKAEAVRHTLYDAISERYPATILRRHPHVRLFLDKDSATLLPSLSGKL